MSTMVERLAAATHCYIGVRSCGCPVALVVDAGGRETAKTVREFIEEGLTIERVPLDAHPNIHRCTHRPRPVPVHAEQESLLA